MDEMLKQMSASMRSIYWGQIYTSTITGSKWLHNKAISPGRWAVGYEYLYVLYRTLDEIRPQAILELGLGQSTKLTGQYVASAGVDHLVIEHDTDWLDFFLAGFNDFSKNTVLHILPLKEIFWKGLGTCKAYDGFDTIVSGNKYELILVDGPFGGENSASRRDIVSLLPSILEEKFAIMIDDCGRVGEYRTAQDILDCLQKEGIEIATGIYDGGGIKKTVVITCKEWRWLTTM